MRRVFAIDVLECPLFKILRPGEYLVFLDVEEGIFVIGHGALAEVRRDRRKAETAVPDHDARHAVPSGQRAVWIPEQLRIDKVLELRIAGFTMLME